MSEWIDASTKIPDEGVRVIVFRPSREIDWDYIDHGMWYDEVTHWMPLPEPPAVAS